MNLVSRFYVTRSSLSPAHTDFGVRRILATSRARNAQLGMTGALFHNEEFFAQVIQGMEASVGQGMTSVASDPSHDNVMVVGRDLISVRRFERWSLAYSGQSQFVARHVSRLLAGQGLPDLARSAACLTELIWELTERPAVT